VSSSAFVLQTGGAKAHILEGNMGATVVGTKVTPTLMTVKISIHAYLEILKNGKGWP
jgi:hypothetical protein